MAVGAPGKFRARPFAQVNAQAIPPSGRSPEAIWHVAYDTQTFASTSTTSLDFFSAINADKSLSNMEAAGQFPAPQAFEMHTIAADLWPSATPVTTDAATAGAANDIYLLMFVGRPRWTFTLQQKAYGPYPLSVLHASGGPEAFISSTVATSSQQIGRNMPHGGWNYQGTITIPAQTSFQFNVTWAAAQTLKVTNWLLRIGLFGVLSRAVK